MEMSNRKHDLGIKVIDRDHREISELLLEINFNVVRDADAGRRIRHLRDLARATRSHFLLEEGMMAASKFPGLPLHRRVARPEQAFLHAVDRVAGRTGQRQGQQDAGAQPSPSARPAAPHLCQLPGGPSHPGEGACHKAIG